ncbi:sigma-54-dependent Fis family transcriptional regulator [Candidatus Saganbacteria bacterium]|nr:sigma-54-dependent Fis family transcriptional regulator [Candidatus Saganbacteria bacterium]
MNKEKPSILVIDDEEDLRLTLRSILKKDYSPQLASSGKEGLKLLKGQPFALVLLDIRMPEMDGLTVLKKIKELDNSLPVVMVTASRDVKSAVEAMKAGAEDFISKPFEVEELLAVIEKVAEKAELKKENQYLKEVLKDAEAYGDLIGQTPEIKKVMALISQTAPTDSTILITGESGTGKEIAAKAIHKLSKRKNGPFIALNCGAIPENLLESELFGHERGAFTGALDRRIGKFELSDGGTIFLDEIGTMSANMQSKLLRVLEDHKIERVGGGSPIEVDVRVLAATNIDFAKHIREGKFREDLYYRLNVIPIQMPSLKDRKDDIPLFVTYFIEKYNRELGKKVAGVSSEVLAYLKSYDFPGNVRELKNIIERAVALCQGDQLIMENLLTPTAASSTGAKNLKQALEDYEANYIKAALNETNGVQSLAAKKLGLHRTTLGARMRALGLK